MIVRRLGIGRGLWRNPHFLKLWGAETISHFGSQVSQLAIPLVAIISLQASAFEAAAVGVSITLPWLLVALPAGAWVDRLRRRPILIAADWGRAALLASLPVAYIVDALSLVQLYAVGFLSGVCTVFFDVAYQSYVPSLVARDELTDANGKLEVSRTAASTGGPAVSGALISLVTAPFAILVDALSYAASALLIRRIEHEEPPSLDRREVRPRLRSDIAEGLRFVFRHPILRASILFVVASNFSTSLIFGIYLVFAVRELELSPATIGLIGTLGGTGLLAGAVLAPRLAARFGIGRVMVTAGAAGGWSLLLIPLAQPESAIPLLTLSEIGFGFCAIVYNVVGISLVQAITPNELLGRMTSSRRFVVFGINPVGMFVGGLLASDLGLRETLWLGAAGASLAFLSLLRSPIPRIRDVVDAEELVAVASALPD